MEVGQQQQLLVQDFFGVQLLPPPHPCRFVSALFVNGTDAAVQGLLVGRSERLARPRRLPNQRQREK
jgi:hypothetical protein